LLTFWFTSETFIRRSFFFCFEDLRWRPKRQQSKKICVFDEF